MASTPTCRSSSVYGNGGLLTTVGDLLTWNENFVTPVVGDAAFVAAQQQVGEVQRRPRARLRVRALQPHLHRVRQVDHSGSTAGYRADLARYPDQHLSVAVLCNVSSAIAMQAGRAVADVYLGGRAKAVAPPTPPTRWLPRTWIACRACIATPRPASR